MKTTMFSLATAALALTSVQAFSQDRSTRPYENVGTASGTTNTAVGVNLTSTSIDINDENAFAFGVFGDFHSSPAFSVGLSLDYWNDEFSSSPTRDVELGDIVIGANGKFHFTDVATGFRPYVLAGLAGHILQVTTSERNVNGDPADVLSSRDRDLEDANFELGADFGAGINYRIQPAMDLVGEIRYRRLFEQTLDLDQMNYSVALAYAM